ncbi:MAG: hypothetical protein WA029_14175, partial [Anaerolineae bacterium]
MSGRGGWGCEFALRKSYEFSHHTHHQPASAGFGVSDREFIHGAAMSCACHCACHELHELSRHTQHQPASAGFGVSDREFIHGAAMSCACRELHEL